MLDRDVLDAAKRCASGLCGEDCAYYRVKSGCRVNMLSDATALIKRLMGEVKAHEQINERQDQEYAKLTAEVERYKRWVNDLQAGMTVNCVYCGHSYGPAENTPASMADVLKEHIEHCPEHPMSKLKAENERLTRERDEAVDVQRALRNCRKKA